MSKDEESTLPLVKVNIVEIGGTAKKGWINCRIGEHHQIANFYRRATSDEIATRTPDAPPYDMHYFGKDYLGDVRSGAGWNSTRIPTAAGGSRLSNPRAGHTGQLLQTVSQASSTHLDQQGIHGLH